MIGIILAGGYAKRLLPLTIDKPKSLLPAGGRPIIDYALDRIASSSSIRKVVVLTNSRFQPQFQSWAQGRQRQDIEIWSDGSLTEEEKPGAVGALASMMSKIDDDFLVIAGDCIYPNGLEGLLGRFREKNATVIGIYRSAEIDQVRRGSAVELGSDNTIVDFVEKPEHPNIDLVGAAVYAFPRRTKDRLKEYFDLGLPRDEPGRFIEWLHKQETVYGYLLDGRVWDIGTIKSYENISDHLASLGKHR